MVQNKAGRPRKFDREEVLDKAIEVFWKKGFEGASLDDLTNAMGINRPSLYSTFKDKQSLYLAAISAYGLSIARAPLVAFQVEKDPKNAVRAFLITMLKNQTRNDGLAQGCLMASCAATNAETIPEVEAMLLAGTKAALSELEKGFEQFKNAGQLSSTFPSGIKAGLLLDIMQGYAYRSRLGEGRKKLMAEIEDKVWQVISCH